MSSAKKPSFKNLMDAPKEVVAPPKKVNMKAIHARLAAEFLAAYGKTPANFRKALANTGTKKTVSAKKGRTRRSKRV